MRILKVSADVFFCYCVLLCCVVPSLSPTPSLVTDRFESKVDSSVIISSTDVCSLLNLGLQCCKDHDINIGNEYFIGCF